MINQKCWEYQAASEILFFLLHYYKPRHNYVQINRILALINIIILTLTTGLEFIKL